MRPIWFWRGMAFLLVVGWLLGVLAAATRPGLLAQDQPPLPPDWRFGVVETYESPDAAGQLGAGWTRVTFHWGEIQAGGMDEWLPPLTDEQLQSERENGHEVTGLLIGLPAWARDEQGLPAGLYLPHDDPGNLWAGYVRQVVGNYAADIQHWVIWNEPDIWDKDAPGHTWDGTEQDFAQLLRVAYLTAKTENPAAVIHLPAFTYFWDANYGREQYMSRLLDVLVADPEAAAHNHYFDIATAHLYFQPDQIFNVLVEFQTMMQEHGLDKPIWLMETNAPPVDDPAWPVESPTLLVAQVEQAAFMPQVIAVALAAGAERIGIFKLIDTETDRAANPEPFGLVRMDGSTRPGYETFALAVQYLSGVRQSTRERWNEVGQIRLDQGDFSTTVLFSRLPAQQVAEIPAGASTGILVNMWGEQQEIRPENGVFRVELPPALCAQSIGDYCMIGGETFYLVQALNGGEPPANLPVRQLSPLSAPFPTATPQAGAAQTTTSLSTVTAAGSTAAETSLPITPTATVTVQPFPSPTTQIEQPAFPGVPENDFPLAYVVIGAALALALALGIIIWRIMRSS